METKQDTDLAPPRGRRGRDHPSPGILSKVMSLPSTLFTTAALALLASQVGCSAPSPTRGGFASPAPAARTHAIEETVRNARVSGTVTRGDLQSMVELLLADDSLVRFMAIAGLEDLTGRTFGYRFFDPAATRYQAILRWREFVLTAETADRLEITPPPDMTTAGTEPADANGTTG